MIDLDIVYPHAGRSYRTSWETVVGCAVQGDAQWRVPISLHYHDDLLDAAIVSRYMARVTANAPPPQRTLPRASPAPTRRTNDSPAPDRSVQPRLLFAPDNAQRPSSTQVGKEWTSSAVSDTASNPSSNDSSVDAVVVLDEHYEVPLTPPPPMEDLEMNMNPGWTLVDLSPRSSSSDASSEVRSPRTQVGSPESSNASKANRAQTEYDDSPTVPVDDGPADAEESSPMVIATPMARVAVPTVSVVMTTYNCVKYLEHAVRSLQSQTLTNWELIVVDDRSTDGTDAQLRALAEEDDRIVYLHNRHNVGCYAAKNTAIAYARGTWLTFHDADDHSMSERLEKQLWYCVTGESERGERARGAHPPPSTADQGYDACYVTSLARKQKVWTWLPITLFMPLALFREKLGAYDTVRFGADSELRKRLHSLRLRVGILKDYLYACPDRWIELSTRTTSLTGDPTKEPIRELYAKGYVDLHRPLQQASTLDEADARLLRYPFPPFKRQDVCTRTHPFVIPGLTEAQAARLLPSTDAIRENLALNSSGEMSAALW